MDYFLILYGDYLFDMSSKIRVFSSYIFSPFFEIEYVATDAINSIESYFSSQKRLSEEIFTLEEKIRQLENKNLYLKNTKNSLNELEEIFNLSKSFQNKEIFLDSGGEAFHYIACLNDNVEHVEAINNLIANKISQL